MARSRCITWLPAGFTLAAAAVLLTACDPKEPTAVDDAIPGEPPAAQPGIPEPEVVSYNFHIRPILSDRCFNCHGPDPEAVEADLQLHDPETATAGLATGEEPKRFAIVPGELARSEVWRRITSDDPDIRMPPPESGRKALTDREKRLVERWIEAGAEYQKHWAFIPPEKADPPEVREKDWVRNPIDAFILRTLESAHVAPSPEADRETLARRLSMDLTGLPPTPEQIDAFLADGRPDAYERYVDQLLASPHFGERLAVDWLDAARYADTNAIHVDMRRSAWPWRDWVIEAFNSNMSYSDFIIAQVAGDLLPEPTTGQLVATCFNRNHPITNEGGVIAEEYLVEYAADRVRTVGSAFLGLTLDCARCHDHKYDPVSSDDYASMVSFFNSVEGELGLEKQNEFRALAYPPFIEVWDEEDKTDVARLETSLKELADKFPWNEGVGEALRDGAESQWIALVPDKSGKRKPKKGAGKKKAPDGKFGAQDKLNIHQLQRDPGKSKSHAFTFPLVDVPGGANLLRLEVPALNPHSDSAVYAFVPALLREIRIEVASRKEGKDKPRTEARKIIRAWSAEPGQDGSGFPLAVDGKPDTLWEIPPSPRPTTIFLLLDQPLKGGVDDKSLRVTFESIQGGRSFPNDATLHVCSKPMAPSHLADHAGFSPLRLIPEKELKGWQKHALAVESAIAAGKLEPGALGESRAAVDTVYRLKRTVPRCMVMREMETPRETFVLKRGRYDMPDKERPRGREIPAVFGALPADAPKNRLGLATWLVSPENPLVSRVTVNRCWQMVFGTGLVKTSADFGAQSDPPSHPELLDYLAVDFQENGWDVKRLLRMCVTSATYRQSSKFRDDLAAIDPNNRLLARAPRFRFQAEFIRDSALAASGLLVPKIGGPSVKPYQPAGLWRERAMRKDGTTGTFYADTGSGLYRRGIYTFWKQAAPPPQMEAFDAPPREVCVIRRSVTNTPAQALILMNDETYLEASRVLGARVMDEVPGPWDDNLQPRLRRAFRLLTGRDPGDEDLGKLEKLTLETHAQFTKDPARADAFLASGEAPRPKEIDKVELASLAFTVSAIMNLDETITRD